MTLGCCVNRPSSAPAWAWAVRRLAHTHLPSRKAGPSSAPAWARAVRRLAHTHLPCRKAGLSSAPAWAWAVRRLTHTHLPCRKAGLWGSLARGAAWTGPPAPPAGACAAGAWHISCGSSCPGCRCRYLKAHTAFWSRVRTAAVLDTHRAC